MWITPLDVWREVCYTLLPSKTFDRKFLNAESQCKWEKTSLWASASWLHSVRWHEEAGIQNMTKTQRFYWFHWRLYFLCIAVAQWSVWFCCWREEPTRTTKTSQAAPRCTLLLGTGTSLTSISFHVLSSVLLLFTVRFYCHPSTLS